MVGADGFILVYFHFESRGIRVLLLFTSLIWVWKCLVGSLVVLWNLFYFMKSWILVSYCLIGRIMSCLCQLVLLWLHCD